MGSFEEPQVPHSRIQINNFHFEKKSLRKAMSYFSCQLISNIFSGWPYTGFPILLFTFTYYNKAVFIDVILIVCPTKATQSAKHGPSVFELKTV